MYCGKFLKSELLQQSYFELSKDPLTSELISVHHKAQGGLLNKSVIIFKIHFYSAL